MSTPRDRRENEPVDLYPQLPACPACQQAMHERYHQQRWIVRLDRHVTVVSHFRECRNPACTRQAVVYRPPQEDALAWRGDTCGLEVVARMGELRYRDNWAITKIREPLQTESPLSSSRKEVALLGEVCLALVTPVARQDQGLIEPLRRVGSIVLAIAGVQPETSHETLDMLRDVCSGRVFVAKTRLSSATPEIEPLIEDVRSWGLPLVGVIRDQQESIWLAVQPMWPTVPHQICQYHYLKDVAPPVCEADRHVKKELNKRVRGSRDVERQAEQLPTKEAQMVADYRLALRTVRRDDGKSPLEPPGVQLYQKLPLIAASVERVRVVHPSALLQRLSRMRSVLNVCQKAYEQFVMRFSWIYQIAHLLQAQISCEEAQSQRLACIDALKHSGLPTELLSVLTSVEKITVALAPHLFESLKQPLLPRTNHALERFIGRIKTSRRHITGRQNTQAFMLREGSCVAMLCGLPPTNHWVDAFSKVNPNDFHHLLNLLRQTDKRRKCWHARRDWGAYLAALEQPWVPHEWVLQR